MDFIGTPHFSPSVQQSAPQFRLSSNIQEDELMMSYACDQCISTLMRPYFTFVHSIQNRAFMGNPMIGCHISIILVGNRQWTSQPERSSANIFSNSGITFVFPLRRRSNFYFTPGSCNTNAIAGLITALSILNPSSISIEVILNDLLDLSNDEQPLGCDADPIAPQTISSEECLRNILIFINVMIVLIIHLKLDHITTLHLSNTSLCLAPFLVSQFVRDVHDLNVEVMDMDVSFDFQVSKECTDIPKDNFDTIIHKLPPVVMLSYMAEFLERDLDSSSLEYLGVLDNPKETLVMPVMNIPHSYSITSAHGTGCITLAHGFTGKTTNPYKSLTIFQSGISEIFQRPHDASPPPPIVFYPILGKSHVFDFRHQSLVAAFDTSLTSIVQTKTMGVAFLTLLQSHNIMKLSEYSKIIQSLNDATFDSKITIVTLGASNDAILDWHKFNSILCKSYKNFSWIANWIRFHRCSNFMIPIRH